MSTSIEWTDETWNPVTGCTPVSDGCTNCYAKRFAERFRGVVGHPYEQGFDLTLHPERLDQPSRWRKPRMVFVCSMSDLFHEAIGDGYRLRVFDAMAAADHHIFQVLTKRPERAVIFFRDRPSLPSHVWMGTTVEGVWELGRLHLLRKIEASVRFLSMEPLLGPMPDDLNLDGIHWVIVGGESGPGARRMAPEWVRGIRNRCVNEHVPFFFKQWGGVNKKRAGHELDGETWRQMPRRQEAGE